MDAPPAAWSGHEDHAAWPTDELPSPLIFSSDAFGPIALLRFTE
ncbi:hypothetical protein ACIBKY_33185 [Nonomuraea sp. NPDC050394]